MGRSAAFVFSYVVPIQYLESQRHVIYDHTCDFLSKFVGCEILRVFYELLWQTLDRGWCFLLLGGQTCGKDNNI